MQEVHEFGLQGRFLPQLCTLWDRDDYSHEVQDYNKEFTVERPLLVIHMAVEDKHKSFFQGDELGIDKRLDTFLLPAQINKLTDFPADLQKKTAYGYAAECMGSIWQHLKYMYIYVYMYTYIPISPELKIEDSQKSFLESSILGLEEIEVQSRRLNFNLLN